MNKATFVIFLLAGALGCSKAKQKSEPFATIGSASSEARACEVLIEDLEGAFVEKVTQNENKITTIRYRDGKEVAKRTEIKSAEGVVETFSEQGTVLYEKSTKVSPDGNRTIEIDDIGSDGRPGTDGETDAVVMVEFENGQEKRRVIARGEQKIVVKTSYKDGVKSKVERMIANVVVERTNFTALNGLVSKAVVDLGADSSEDLFYSYVYDDQSRLQRVERTGVEVGTITYRYDCP